MIVPTLNKLHLKLFYAKMLRKTIDMYHKSLKMLNYVTIDTGRPSAPRKANRQLLL